MLRESNYFEPNIKTTDLDFVLREKSVISNYCIWKEKPSKISKLHFFLRKLV